MKGARKNKFLLVACYLAFGIAVLSIPSIFSPFIKKQGVFMPALSGGIVAVEFISVVGIWYMKRWGVRLYILSTAMAQAMKLYLDNWSMGGLIVPLLVIAAGLHSYRSMKEDL